MEEFCNSSSGKKELFARKEDASIAISSVLIAIIHLISVPPTLKSARYQMFRMID